MQLGSQLPHVVIIVVIVIVVVVIVFAAVAVVVTVAVVVAVVGISATTGTAFVDDEHSWSTNIHHRRTFVIDARSSTAGFENLLLVGLRPRRPLQFT